MAESEKMYDVVPIEDTIRLPPLTDKGLAPASKRVFDLGLAAFLLLVCVPPLLLLFMLVRLDGGPALFRQSRIGQGGQPFGIIKFRTMVVDADAVLARHLASDPAAAAEWAQRQKLANDPRVTRLGRVLRASSLDELPQLFNVLRGEMSLVGPRPVKGEELDRHYGTVGRHAYLSVRPGITGLWQVSGRSETTYEERVALDIRYVEGRSLMGDIRLLLLTLPVVLSRRGAV